MRDTQRQISGLADLVEAKRREIEAMGIDFGYRYPWPFGPFPTDDEKRTAPHGDPLMEAMRR